MDLIFGANLDPRNIGCNRINTSVHEHDRHIRVVSCGLLLWPTVDTNQTGGV